MPQEDVALPRTEARQRKPERARLLVHPAQEFGVVLVVVGLGATAAEPQELLDPVAALVVLQLARSLAHVLERDPAADELHRRAQEHVCRVLVHVLLGADGEDEALERHRRAFEELLEERTGARDEQHVARSGGEGVEVEHLVRQVPVARVDRREERMLALGEGFDPDAFVALAYDAGSVTTGVLTAPVMLALALGVSSVLGDRAAVADGFGLLGLGSIGPIVLILLLGILLP